MIGFILAAITYKKRILHKGMNKSGGKQRKTQLMELPRLACTITDLIAKKNTMKYLDTLERRSLSFPYDEKLAANCCSLMFKTGNFSAIEELQSLRT